VQIPPSPIAHACCPFVQSDAQMPPEHRLVESQALPHAPQLFWSFFVLTHAPLHDVWTAGHEADDPSHASPQAIAITTPSVPIDASLKLHRTIRRYTR
jgi:hypothetical protein